MCGFANVRMCGLSLWSTLINIYSLLPGGTPHVSKTSLGDIKFFPEKAFAHTQIRTLE